MRQSPAVTLSSVSTGFVSFQRHTRQCKSAAESDLHQQRQKEKETLGPRTASWLAREPVDVLSVLQRMIFQHLLHNITQDPARAYSSPGRPALPHRPSPCITPIKGAALCQPGHRLAPELRLFGVEVIFTCSPFFLTPLPTAGCHRGGSELHFVLCFFLHLLPDCDRLYLFIYFIYLFSRNVVK